MLMKRLSKLSILKWFWAVKLYWYHFFFEIFSVNADKSFKSLFFGLKFNKKSNLLTLKISNKLIYRSKLCTLLFDLLGNSFFNLLLVSCACYHNYSRHFDIVSINCVFSWYFRRNQIVQRNAALFYNSSGLVCFLDD